MKTSSFLLYKDHCRLKPIGDNRIFTVEISAYTGKDSAGPSIFSQFSIHCFDRGPSLGEYFLPGLVGDHRNSRYSRHLSKATHRFA